MSAEKYNEESRNPATESISDNSYDIHDTASHDSPKEDAAPEESMEAKSTAGRTPVRKAGKAFKRILTICILLLLAYIAYSVLHIFLSPDRNIRQVYLVPKDAAIIIQTSEPVKDWRRFSQSEPWQTLKQAGTFAEIAYNTELLDSIVHNNKALLSLVGKRDLTISLHKTRTSQWDFLILVDMRRASKMEMLKEQVENILKLSGSKVTRRVYEGIAILEMQDQATGEILYTAFIDNHFAASYTSRLVEAAIEERHAPYIGVQHGYLEAEKLVAGKGLCRIFIQYEHLPSFMSIYLGGKNEYVDMLSRSMEFAGLWFDASDSRLELKGQTIRADISDPYVGALLSSGKQKMRAHEILPSRTAFYTNIGFDNPVKFVAELESILAEDNPAEYESFNETRRKLERYFGISMQDNFLSWMSGEFALAQLEPGLLGREPEQILAIRAKNIKTARQNMELLEKRIKNRSPVKIKSTEYKGYTIHYVEMKGFFRLFFGGIFDGFEKPYYTYVDDYVVFSTKPSTLLSFIEDHSQKNTLKDSPAFRTALGRTNNTSTIFLYADLPKFHPQLLAMVKPATAAQLNANSDVLLSFPVWSLQINGGAQKASVHYCMEYMPAAEYLAGMENDTDEDHEDKSMSDKELMNELKRFYVEKFEGNVLRDYYESGALKSEAETKNGKRNGRYREYSEDGRLIVRGKYSNNRPKGVWKYYSAEGKFERKEKY